MLEINYRGRSFEVNQKVIDASAILGVPIETIINGQLKSNLNSEGLFWIEKLCWKYWNQASTVFLSLFWPNYLNKLSSRTIQCCLCCKLKTFCIKSQIGLISCRRKYQSGVFHPWCHSKDVWFIYYCIPLTIVVHRWRWSARPLLCLIFNAFQ